MRRRRTRVRWRRGWGGGCEGKLWSFSAITATATVVNTKGQPQPRLTQTHRRASATRFATRRPAPNAAPRNARVVWTGTLEAGTRRCSKHGARTRGPDASRCPRRKQLCARQREADNTLPSRQAGFLLQAELLDVRRLRLADMVERVLEAGLLRGGDFGSRGLLGGHGATRATLGYSTRQSVRAGM